MKQSITNLLYTVEQLEKNSELSSPPEAVYRPWGTYKVLKESKGYKIKKIIVDPNSRLSLQSHKYRDEHWIVVSGLATVALNGKTFTLDGNGSTYIKAGDKHRLANNTDTPLTVIETQIGSYLDEDDIVRYDDDFIRY
jgi:mannose-1-phosphate guanylyltransferase